MTSCATASRWRCVVRTARESPKPFASSTGTAPERNDFLLAEPGLVCGRTLREARRSRRLRQRPAAPLHRTEGKPQGDGRRLQRQPLRLPRDDPTGLCAQRLRHPVERTGSRRSARAHAPLEYFNEWKRIDDEDEPGVVSLDTLIARHVPAGAVSRHRRELHRLRGRQRAASSRSSAKTHQLLGVNRAHRRGRQDQREPGAARRLLAHPGLGQEPVDAVLRPEGAAQEAGRLDVRHRHRPRRTRRPDRRDLRRLRRADQAPRGRAGAKPRAPEGAACAATSATSSR